MSVSGRLAAIVAPAPPPFVGPLDALTATAAYSMRRLLTSYAANKAINVRRASDQATTDVGFLANGDLDVPSLTTFLAATSGFDTTWYDQVGANDVAQSTAANQPAITLASTLVGNRPAIRFLRASATGLVKSSTPVVNQPYTISVVAANITPAVPPSTIVNTTTSFLRFAGSGAPNFVQAGAPTAVSATSTDGIAHCLLATFNGASSKMAVDQVLSGALNPGTSATGGMSLGFISGAQFLDGIICEVILFPSVLSDADIGILQANQKAYWGTP